MPLSDLFKKPSKKEPAKASQADSPEMQKKRYEAAMEFLKSFQERMPLVNGKPHAGTVLAVAARLAGTSLYRSLNYQKDLAPGTVVLSEEVNQAWPPLMNLFAFYCKKNGMDVLAKPLVTTFPEKDKPRMSVDEVLKAYQDQYNEIMQRYGLDYLNAARAGMVICSIVFKYHTDAKDIDPYVATGIVAMGVVEGAKTAPPPYGSKLPESAFSEESARKKSRFLIGEREAVIQESNAHGGTYFDPNPGVLQTLQAGNIDPYMIYERALRDQIEKKVSRIDFVKADVDRLFDEWKTKPYTQAPMHVRLLLWLKNNASTYGYEQTGNSWVLKK